MNPLGLLIAYAEKEVKPVCSDFDTFTVGSRGMKYDETPSNQLDLVTWCLDHTQLLLEDLNSKGWTGRWLEILKKEDERGFHPTFPEFGFGDPTSYRLIEDVVNVTRVCGAVRHGAECFNFYFPQELDDDFLIIWSGFSDPPWRTFKEPELRQWLIDRAKDGYAFPMNPVWAARDVGWFDVLQALKASPDGAMNLKSWFPPDSGILEKIEAMHHAHPGGFKTIERPVQPPPPPKVEDKGQDKGQQGGRSMSMLTNILDGFGK